MVAAKMAEDSAIADCRAIGSLVPHPYALVDASYTEYARKTSLCGRPSHIPTIAQRSRWVPALQIPRFDCDCSTSTAPAGATPPADRAEDESETTTSTARRHHVVTIHPCLSPRPRSLLYLRYIRASLRDHGVYYLDCSSTSSAHTSVVRGTTRGAPSSLHPDLTTAIAAIRTDYDSYEFSKNSFADFSTMNGRSSPDDVSEGMNLNPIYGLTPQSPLCQFPEPLPDRVENLVRACERHLAVVVGGLPGGGQEDDTSSAWFLDHGRSGTTTDGTTCCEVVCISHRTRGIGDRMAYLSHWHTDFDYSKVGATKEECQTNHGEEVLEEFLCQWAGFVLSR